MYFKIYPDKHDSMLKIKSGGVVDGKNVLFLYICAT